ncbi:MAG TPA: GntR family transcriptional regulator [Longimicrobiaceae bacterium]|jgi:DNA-binding GntR family transcriptional regulator|nr:GntR family transcriptional regulator [Longimicrobiaceae bacterium]
MTLTRSRRGPEPPRSTIARAPLRDQVHHALVGRILRDELPPESRLSDSVLAGELGVSRTPVREALLRLEREGFLQTDPGRGFFVKALSAREVREVYPVLWTLECLALTTAPPPPPAALAELEWLNGQIARSADDPEQRIELDTRWHRTLVEGCGNAMLLETIAGLKSVLHRYEYAYMMNSGSVPASTRSHDEIAAAAGAGETERAADLLRAHWRLAIDDLVPWLETRG